MIKKALKTIIPLMISALLVLGCCIAYADNTPATVSLAVRHIADEDDTKDYNFRLDAISEDAPLPLENRLVITGAGNSWFPDIVFTAPGSYKYRVVDQKGEYYTIDIFVSTDANGVLDAIITTHVADTAKKTTEIVFVDVTPPSPTEVDDEQPTTAADTPSTPSTPSTPGTPSTPSTPSTPGSTPKTSGTPNESAIPPLGLEDAGTKAAIALSIAGVALAGAVIIVVTRKKKNEG